MDLELRTAYWDDLKARSAFKEFVLQIHGLDFSEWESAGYWDDAYTPFSFFRGDTVIASVCVYLLDAVIEGRTTHVAQLSGVGTLPEWRRKGLNRQLTDIALSWAKGKHEGLFLFADTHAIPFYEKCGFEPLVEYVELANMEPVPNRGGAVRIDCGQRDGLDRIYQYARRRVPVSDKFSILNEKLVMFHVLYDLRSHVYEVPDPGCIVFFERKAGCLRIYDIVGERVPPLMELYPYIADDRDRLVEFHFHTDRLGLEAIRMRPLRGNNCLVRGPFPVEKLVFPFTSRA